MSDKPSLKYVYMILGGATIMTFGIVLRIANVFNWYAAIGWVLAGLVIALYGKEKEE